MAYYVSANAPKFVAIVGFGCGPLCESSMSAFYELHNGQLFYRTSHFFTPAMQEKVSKGMAVAQKKISLTDPSAGLSQWVKLPHKGTTIQIGFMEQGGAVRTVRNFSTPFTNLFTTETAALSLWLKK